MHVFHTIRAGSIRPSAPVLQINLRLIMVSGKSREFLFGTHDSAGDIAQFVFDTWPEGEWILVLGGESRPGPIYQNRGM